MTSVPAFDDDLVRRLPLPLAQLYRRAHNAKTALERHLTAYCLWEASLKLLGSAAIVAYADQGQHDPEITERLRNLARPALGHWREFVRLLLPKLAVEDSGFRQAAEVLGRTRDDLPRAAGLDATLRETLDGQSGARSTVRLDELFDRLVRYRNRELGHGAAGQAAEEVYERVGANLLLGVAEILGRLDVLAGRRLVFVADVRRQGSGDWLVESYELTGENPRRLPSVVLPSSASDALPNPGRVYLSLPRGADVAAADAGGPLRSLHPLVTFDPDSAEAFFLNARRGTQRGEYLCYASGRVADRRDAGSEQRELLARVLGMAVDEVKVGEWAARSQAEEPPGEPQSESDGARPRRIGEFEIMSELGRGGMGVVYRAWQPSLGRQVALKSMLRVGDPKAEARFAREIRALGKVDHPHLVKIFASGSEGDRWFYAMELIDGLTLGSLCERLAGTSATAVGVAEWRRALTVAYEEERRKEVTVHDDGPGVAPGPAAPAERPASSPRPVVQLPQGHIAHVVEIMGQVAEAAHALHEAGVIHRDIKPGNILLTPDGAHVVLMDLGLAQLADEAQGKLTRTRQFVGTLRYASPEQVLAVGGLDRRTDVYSLGATLWELLTLQPLYAATDETPSPELMQRIQSQEPDAVRKYNPRVPRDLEAIVLKCLEKDPKRRYATAQELADDLQRFLKHEPVRARPIGPIQRLARRARRRPAAALAILLFALAVPTLLGFGYWYWDTHTRLKVEYYAQFAYRHEVPVGIERVTEEQARHRSRTWKFQLEGGRVKSMALVNGSGSCPTTGALMAAALARTDQPARDCSMEFLRNEQGDVIKVIARDRLGHVDWTFLYSTPTAGYYADEEGIPRARSGTGAAFIKVALTPDGLRDRLSYLDKDGKPQANAEGIFTYHAEYDARGLPVRTQWLGADDQPVRNKDGYAEVTVKYDDQGNAIENKYFDESGRPTRIKDGSAGWTEKYDDHGNAIESTFFDEAGRPTTVNAGYVRLTARYDDRGNAVEMACFDDASRPTVITEGFARWTAQYDARGNPVQTDYFDRAGQPTRQAGGVARITRNYDERGNLVETACFDEAGQPTRHKDGNCRRRNQYDDRGNEIEAALFDETGQPVRVKAGYAGFKAKFDARGNRVELAYFDPAGQPTRNKQGYARWVDKYNERGNLVEEAYFDEADRPTRNQYGVARETFTYDDRGHQVEAVYFDEAGRRTRHKLGYARWVAQYDDRGDETGETYFDTADRLTRIKDGYAQVKIAHDRSGHITERRYFNSDGRPTWHKDGYARVTMKYDDRGNRVEEDYYDEKDQLVRTKSGYAQMKLRYDDRGHLMEVAYFDEQGRPTPGPDGFPRVQVKYDERGRRVEQAYLDGDGHPARHKDGNARATWEYDERGNNTEVAFFDENNHAVKTNDGYARETGKYDERDNRVESAYFDEARQPVQAKNGYARVTWKYDDRGNTSEAAYFDKAGQPTRHKDGNARVTWKYDDRDRKIEHAYFDEEGRPTAHKDGNAIWRSKFDERGNSIESAYFDANGHPVCIKDGYARIAAKYDERSNKIEVAYFDAQDKPVRTKSEGIARWTVVYDERDNRIGQDYFDEAGHAVRSTYGYASWKAKFDDRGKQTEEAYFDEAGQLKDNSRGVARWVARYDDRGQLIERLNYDAAGKPLVSRVVITGVAAGGQGQKLGLQKDDILLTYGGQEVKDTQSFIQGRKGEPASGKPQELVVLRGDKRLTFQVKPGLLGASLANHTVPSESNGDPMPVKPN